MGNIPPFTLLLFGLISTCLFTILSFLKLKFSNLFIDFTVFLLSLIVAISLSIVLTKTVLLLQLMVFLYINALWLYGIEGKSSMKKQVINPSLPRVFVGFVLFLIASWLCFSTIDPRVALIVILLSTILGAYRLKSLYSGKIT